MLYGVSIIWTAGCVLGPPATSAQMRPERRDLVEACRDDERVRAGDCVLQAAGPVVDVDPEDLAEQRVQALCPIARVAGASAVAQGDVQEAVGSERELAAIVVGIRLG